MKQATIFLLLSIALFSCKKETEFLECTSNCKTFSLQGRVYNGISNVGFANTAFRLTREFNGAGCFYCPADKYDIYAGKTDAAGNFNFPFTLDTSRMDDFSLRFITPEKENFSNSYPGYVDKINPGQVPINVVYYPTTTLTLKLLRVQNDTLKFISISHKWKQLHGSGQWMYMADYNATRPIAGGDTTIHMKTVADLPTTVIVGKRFPNNSSLDIKDSIICRQGQPNVLTMYY